MFAGILMCDALGSVLLSAVNLRQPLNYAIHLSSLPDPTITHVLSRQPSLDLIVTLNLSQKILFIIISLC
jgi:hypothetical protein